MSLDCFLDATITWYRRCSYLSRSSHPFMNNTADNLRNFTNSDGRCWRLLQARARMRLQAVCVRRMSPSYLIVSYTKGDSDVILPVDFCCHLVGKNCEKCLPLPGPSASEVATLWRYANRPTFIIIMSAMVDFGVRPRHALVRHCVWPTGAKKP